MRNAGRAARTPAIGFLAARLDEPYQYAVWSGAVEEAERLGAAVVFFGGQRLGSPVGFEALDNIAFDLAARSGVAGLAVMANVIGTYLTPEQLGEFLGRFGPLPVVSVGVAAPGAESVLIDNSGGMAAVADHLLTVHRRRRFLFLAGPAGHAESLAREAEFRSRLSAALGEGAEPAVEHCDFQELEAYAAVARRLAAGERPDAVVAANDLMAMGALRALAEAGLEVPRDVSVTGFDDTEDSRFSLPPLTTVRQNARELGRSAVRRLAVRMGLAQGEAEPEGPSISFVLRESCGCQPAALADLAAPAAAAAASAPPLSLEGFARDVNRALAAGRNPAGLITDGLAAVDRARARLIVAEGESRYQAVLRRAAERRAAVLREIEASLVASFALPDILEQVARGTRSLGISACRLALFESGGGTPEWARLLLAADGDRVRILAPYGLRFRTAEFLPGGLPARWKAYVCEPLRFGDERLGYLVCTADGTDRRVFGALRDQVASALKGALLMAAERDRERRLEHEVRARTLELSDANIRLKEEIGRRSELERELLDISNDIMGRIGRDIHDDLCQDIAGIGLMAAVLEGGLRRSGLPEAETAADAAAAISRAAGRTAAQAKGIARGLYPAELEAKGLVEAVADLVRAASGRSAAKIELEVTPGFQVKDSERALQLYRIIQEALSNALAHAEAGRIAVALRMDREAVLVEVADDGRGLPAAAQRRSGGMGLRIMKYRASVIGGEFRVRSSTAGGSAVSCRVAR
jgi:DNA-binding LacI/PurR family transcriptional regulator/signal transduction histidine kinase